MIECPIATPHPPHCPKCDGPVSIWFYDDLEPGSIVSAGNCQANCVDIVPCDGGLSSPLGDWRTLDSRSAGKLTQKIATTSTERANQCLHQPGCTDQTIEAHTVPRNWLRVIGPRNIYLFRPSPNPSAPPGQVPPIPHKVSIRRATTAGFTCAEHDAVFQPADERNGNPTSPHRLNLLFYRAVLKAMHGEIAAEEIARTHLGSISGSAKHGSAIANQRLLTLSLASELLRTSLIFPALNWRVRHITRQLTGTPSVACSSAGVWDHHWVDFLSGPATPIESNGVWGITVIPTDHGHSATLHYCTVALDQRVAEFHLKKMDLEMTAFKKLQGIPLEEAISTHAIVLTEDLCIGTRAWDSLPSRRKESFKNAWLANTWIPNGQFGRVTVQGISSDEVQDLNLFR